jgi:hypothetical protein
MGMKAWHGFPGKNAMLRISVEPSVSIFQLPTGSPQKTSENHGKDLTKKRLTPG